MTSSTQFVHCLTSTLLPIQSCGSNWRTSGWTMDMEWCADRHPSISNVPPPVGPGCVDTADPGSRSACNNYKIAVLTYKVLCGTAPRYLKPLTRVADVPGRADFQTFNYWQPSISGCCLADLERAARRRNIGIDFVVIPAPTEDSSVLFKQSFSVL